MERIGVAPGTEIGGYRVLSPLGRGGMGDVYRAIDGDGTIVALKLLHPHLGGDPDARERLRREVAHLQRVRHPGVARVLDAEIESAEAFVVTELVDGEDLNARVRTRGALSGAELADLAEQLRAALLTVHAAGVLHRDLTPGNVLVTDRGPVLIDFGIAQAVDDARVTSTGLVVGTPGYLSPELLEGGEPSEAGDWWGWAALLAFAATGRPPFGVRPLQSVLARASSGDADLGGLDQRTQAALRSALAVDPDARAGPEQVVTELRRAADGDTGSPHEALAPWDEAATQVVGPGGGTRVLPAGAAPELDTARLEPAEILRQAEADRVAGLADEEDAFDDDGGRYVDDGQDDDDGRYDDDELADGAPGPGGYVAPEPRRRIGTVLAVGAAALAAGALRPGVALLCVVVLGALVRSVGRAVEGFHARRARRGVRRGDLAAVLASSPWYLVRGVVGVLPAALVAASIVVLVGGVGWWLLDTGRFVLAAPPPGEGSGELMGNAGWVPPVAVATGALLGLLAFWFGPMSRTTRLGARWTLAAVAPGPWGAAVVIAVALGATAVLLALVPEQETVWWPLPGPPDLR